uniref:sensor histidine kinase n=1 Tax=uncultured Acinetobacter sp. TaxID=165433 RepID=UPI002609D756|nr:HAMP domain-containing sensor histidine kinase [uncultured Acinetobacter sp.]
MPVRAPISSYTPTPAPEGLQAELSVIVSEHIDATVDFLCKLSRYSHAIYYYQYKDMVVANSTTESIPKETVQEICQQVAHCAKGEQLDSESSIFETIQGVFEDSHDFAPESIYVVGNATASTESTLTIILCADKTQLIPVHMQTCLDEYILQRYSSLQMIIDSKTAYRQLADLEEINASRSKYFSIIAHDLRAPFHGILSCADILMHERATLDDEASLRLVEYINDTAQSTYSLLESLLNWAMAEGGRFHFKPVHFNVNDVVQSVVDLLNSSAFKKKIKLKCDVAGQLYAFGDVRMMTSVIQNLTSNALKFTNANADKEILICAQQDQNWVEIRIQDQGVGMTEMQREKLFQQDTIPSTQGTSGEKGTGLGLVLCKRFVENNGGTIAVESIKNQGTRFIVRIPVGSIDLV